MGITDVIKKSVLEGFNAGNLTTGTIAVTLGMSVLLGLFIYFIYRTSVRSGFYNRGFNKALASMPLIVAAIMLAMQSNLVISLGMVGALSIVRFRNAVKESSDLTYVFWSISAGIIVGAGLYELAILMSLCMTVLAFGLDLVPSFRSPCLLVVSGSSEADEAALTKAVRQFGPKARVRSHNVSTRGHEWIFELQVRDGSALLQAVTAVTGITGANLLSHDGDVRF